MKCVDPRCTFCREQPVKAVNAWKYLVDRDFKWMNPIEQVTHPGHYMTFMEMNDSALSTKTIH